MCWSRAPTTTATRSSALSSWSPVAAGSISLRCARGTRPRASSSTSERRESPLVPRLSMGTRIRDHSMNLAIFLPNWIGDAVMATPALRALRKHFARSARIIGVMKPYVAGVLEGGDWFDERLLTHDGTWRRGVAATAWKLRCRGVDLAILLPNSPRPAFTAWLGGCRHIVGYARYGRSLLLHDALQPRRSPSGELEVSPVIHAYNLLAERVGCPTPGTDLELFTTPKDD